MNNIEILQEKLINKLEEMKREMDCLDEEICTEEKAKGFISGLQFAIDLINECNNTETTLEEIIWDYISTLSDEYKEEINIDKLDDEDIGNIVIAILDRSNFHDIVYEEIEYMACAKESKEE